MLNKSSNSDFLRSEECLWNVNSPECLNTDHHKTALLRINMKLDGIEPGLKVFLNRESRSAYSIEIVGMSTS